MRLLKSIYNSIFGKSKKDVSKLVSSSFSLSDMASLADGMEFLPTFLLRTPVSILKRNGEIYRGDTPPLYTVKFVMAYGFLGLSIKATFF